MKKKLPILLAAMLISLFVCFVGASGEEEHVFSFGTFSESKMVNASFERVSKGWSDGVWDALDRWCYVRDSLPEGIQGGGLWEALCLYPQDGEGDYERITAASVDFISGDEALRNALCFRLSSEDDVHIYLTDHFASISPGKAVFRIRAESENLYYETDFTLWELDWKENPLFEFRNPDRSIEVKLNKGEVPENGMILSWESKVSTYYTLDQLATLLIQDHSSDIAAQILPEESRQRFSSGSGERFEFFGNVPEEQVWQAYIVGGPYARDDSGWVFQDYGEYAFSFYDEWFDVSSAVSFKALAYNLNGPTGLTPGTTGTYQIRDAQPETGRTFTLSMEGEGAEFDPESGRLTVSVDAAEGTEYVISGTPSDGGAAVSIVCTVSNGALSGVDLKPFYILEGFTVPVPADGEQFASNQSDPQNLACYSTDQYAPNALYLDYKVYDPIDEFIEKAEDAEYWYDLGAGNMDGAIDLQRETILIDGHPARVYVMTVPSSSGEYSLGIMIFGRNNRICRTRLFSEPQNGTTLADLPKVTLGDMQRLADAFSYDPGQASITTADGEITLNAKGNATTLSGGKKLQLTAAFANKDKVNKKAKNDTVEWSVADAETGESLENIRIDKKGSLSADKTLAEVKRVVVTAASPVFHTRTDYEVTVMPAVTGLTAEPSTLTFYTGETREETVKATLVPDTVPPAGITWTAKPEKIVDIMVSDDGSAKVKPLAAGKTVLTVKDAGGKSAKVNISVLEPVESVELKVKGKTVPGGAVTLTAALFPKKAGNKNMEWSVNVNEDIATISAKGQLKISKTAPEGTIITVTCKALGAPEPVVTTVDIIVGQ